MSTQLSELPEFEKFSGEERCGKQTRSFVPLRRESKLGKIIYCYGKARGLKTYVDIFTSWGGGSLLLAGGMSATVDETEAKGKSLVGWEIGKHVRSKDTKAEEIHRNLITDFMFYA